MITKALGTCNELNSVPPKLNIYSEPVNVTFPENNLFADIIKVILDGGP